jgi:hypothetical protein
MRFTPEGRQILTGGSPGAFPLDRNQKSSGYQRFFSWVLGEHCLSSRRTRPTAAD